VTRFYRQRELGTDPTNWFAPTLVTLADWCASCTIRGARGHQMPEMQQAENYDTLAGRYTSRGNGLSARWPSPR
jgi:hypothetical protein